jgi:gliding motility-associated-like protein
MMRNLFLSIFAAFLPIFLSAQMQITASNTTPFTPENLITNVFLGSGVEVVSVVYGGDKKAAGYFSTANSVIGIERGIVLSSGNVETGGGALGANEKGADFASSNTNSNVTDPDLAAATAPNEIKDVSIYTITFIPIADTLRFKYVFASEEYPEYACSSFNDVFGFFISGPNPSGGNYVSKNIAIIPNTAPPQPVTINTLHGPFPPNMCAGANAQFYNNNDGSNKEPTYDGFTDVLTAEAVVIPCSTYTIKIAIADASDEVFDSAVFLEAKSFGTGSLDVAFSTVSLDGTITEGCTDGVLTFRLPFATQVDFPIDYQIFGTAVDGIDYKLIPNGLKIAAGDSVLVIPIIAFEDNLAETGEFLAVDVRRDICNRDTFYIYLRDNGLVAPNLGMDTTICAGNSVFLDGSLPIPLPQPQIFTNPNDYTIDPFDTPIFSPINVFGAQPFNLGPGVIRSVCVDFSHTFIDDIDLFLLSPDGRFMELTTDNGKNANNMLACFKPLTSKPVISLNDSLKLWFPPGGNVPGTDLTTYFSGDWAAEGFWSDLWDAGSPTNGLWKLLLRDDTQGFKGVLNEWSITFEPSYKVFYNWSPTTGLTLQNCPNCPTTIAKPAVSTIYTLTAIDNYGCVVKDSIEIEVIEVLDAPVVACIDQNPTFINFGWAAVANATGYEVSINGGAWMPANGNLQHLVSGLSPSSTITIQVRATGNCAGAIGTQTCQNCNIPTVSFLVTPATCFGVANGTITLLASGLNPPFDFKIGTIANQTGQFSTILAGNYVATITDASGCAANILFEITEPPAFLVDAQISKNIKCAGAKTGELKAILTGGVAPISILWNDSNAQTTATATNLMAGNYQISVTDANGCTAIDNAQLLDPAPVMTTITSSPAKCFGVNSGSATVSASGGLAPFTYLWNDPLAQKTKSATNLLAGNFTVIVTDANGCTATNSILVSEPTQLSATVSVGQTSCNGGSDGSAMVTPAGGTPNYIFKWSGLPAQTTGNATGLQSILYKVTISDANACSIVVDVDVAAPPFFAVVLTPTPTKCAGSKDGQILATPNGGSGGYLFDWSDPTGQISATAIGLEAGNFTVTVTDLNGCTVENSAIVTAPLPISISEKTTNVVCFGENNGKIELDLTGGTPAFSILWNNNLITQTIDNQPVGTYSAIITDQNGCTKTTANITLTEPTEIDATFLKMDAKCFGSFDGKIDASATGGNGNFTFNWTGPASFISQSKNLTAIQSGEYLVTITDEKGCSKIFSEIIGQPLNALLVNLPPVSDGICFGETTGQAVVSASGGTIPYNYIWSNGQTTDTVKNLPAGDIFVTVTDAANCSVIDTTEILQKEAISADIIINQPLCQNAADGSATVTQIFYGNTPATIADFSILWNTPNPQSGASANNLLAGETYVVRISDAAGCSILKSISLQNPASMTASIDQFSAAKCFGESSGSATASVVGGIAPFGFLWSQSADNQQVMTAINLPAGTHSVTVTDINGCKSAATAALGQPQKLTMNFEKIDVQCFGESTGLVQSKPTGGTSPYQFSWSNGAQIDRAENLAAGNISVTVTDQNMCTATENTAVKQPDSPVSASGFGQGIQCFNQKNGRISIAAAGGTSPYDYGLDGQTWNGSPIQIGLAAGIYQGHVRDANGCKTTTSDIEVADRGQISLEIGPDFTILLGQSSQLFLTISGGQKPYEIIWDPADSLWLSCMDCADPKVDSLFYEHTFRVLVIDSSGCSAEDFITVFVDKPRRVFVPTGFTPNGDGENDILMIHGQKSVKIIQFRVFDRWGEPLFEVKNFDINDETIGWDGHFRGKESDPGLYIWTLEVEYLDFVREFLKGQTMLIR